MYCWEKYSGQLKYKTMFSNYLLFLLTIRHTVISEQLKYKSQECLKGDLVFDTACNKQELYSFYFSDQ